ncbi:MAG TPA: helix-hairpin-helix domain-containing protein [Caulobacteraceae bacterium]|nr:helix-hairpin-helix domain-containing protein [Caulobacteraceae bacterium]
MASIKGESAQAREASRHGRRSLRPGAAPSSPSAARTENPLLAARLEDYADLLEAEGADTFRVRAFRRAAAVIERLPTPVRDILAREGRTGLEALPGVGPRIAAALAEMCLTGRWSQLDRMRGEADPATLFRTIPGIGRELSQGLVENLHLASLEGLEAAAHDGRLAVAPGWGPRRARMVQSALAERLGRFPSRRTSSGAGAGRAWRYCSPSTANIATARPPAG